MQPFQGFSTFLKTPNVDDRPISVIGVPYDGSNSFRPGARLGPNAIRSASMMLTDGAHPNLGIDPATIVSDRGDIPVCNIDVTKSLSQIEDGVGRVLDSPLNGLTMLMGGDHTITLGSLRAFAKRHPELFLVHLDAHADTWSDHFGEPIGHGTFIRNAIEEGLLRPENVFSMGLRSPIDPVTRDWLMERGGTAMSSRTIMRRTPTEMAHEICKRVRGRPVYLTIDIDVLDPAFAPGTGTPECGGLTTAYVLEMIEQLYRLDIVGADVVEVSPPFDHSQITALAAATILWTIATVKGLNL